jgi:Protein of unknown function
MQRAQKVKFGSAERKKIRGLPSARVQGVPPVHSPVFSRPKKKIRRRYLVFVFTAVMIPVLVYGLVRSGFVAPIIEREAVLALNQMLPNNLYGKIGDTRVVLDGSIGIGVLLDGFELSDSSSGAELVSIERTTVGVRALPLLRGVPQVSSLSLEGVRIDLPTAGAVPELPEIATLDSGLTVLFDTVRQILARSVLNGSVMAINAGNVTIAGGGLGEDGEILVRTAELKGAGQQRTFEAELLIGGKAMALTGSIEQSAANSVSIRLRGTDIPLPIGRLRTMLSADSRDHEPDAKIESVLSDISINAYDTPSDEPHALSFQLTPADLALKLDDGDFVPLDGTLSFAWEPENEQIVLRNSLVSLGRSSGTLSGAIRDFRGDDIGEKTGRYEFQLLVSRGVSNPEDSPEPPVRFAARSLGSWSPSESSVEITSMEIDSNAGYAEAVGTLNYGAGISTAVFAVSIRDFALPGVKQFWPAPVARGARRWVLSNLAGGRVTEGDFLIAEPLRRRIPGSEERLQGDTEINLAVEGVRFDVAGDIPPVRDAKGHIVYKDKIATITLDSGTAFLPSGRTADASKGTLVIHPENSDGLIMADMDLEVAGQADAIGELISFRPINAQSLRTYEPDDLSGDVDARVTMRFALNGSTQTPPPDWNVDLNVVNAAIATPFEGRQLSELTGRIKMNAERADIDVNGRIDGLPAEISMVQPFGGVPSQRDITLKLSDGDRKRIAPGLEFLISGTTPVKVSSGGDDGAMAVTADLSSAELSLPWIGWAKGSGIGAKSVFDLVLKDSETQISNFSLDGNSFSAIGDITVAKSGLQRARFGKVQLNKTDDLAVTIDRKGTGYSINVEGGSFDARALLRHVRKQLSSSAASDGVPVDLTATISSVTGFGDEDLKNVKVKMRYDGKDVVFLTVSALTKSGFPVMLNLEGAGAQRKISLEALGAGELLRFADIYGQVRGGVLKMALSGRGASRLAGPVNLDDFRIFNEPRLKSLVSTRTGNSKSLNEAIKREIDTSEVKFDRASADISIGPGSLDVETGVVRGPLVGSTFQGTVYDRNNKMRITGTFLPAYGLNSLFADIPILGVLLGNGRDRGLIGVTYLLEGDAKKPEVSVNPLSVIAPGVFRSIFEYR